MKKNLLDTTFIIPIRLDSITRLENIVATVNHLLRNFKTNIIILESSGFCNKFIKRLLPSSIKYVFIRDLDCVFYRTKYLNILSKMVTTPYIGIWDSDIIIDKNQIHDCILKLRSGDYDIAYPYVGLFLDTGKILRDLYIEHPNISMLKRHKTKMELLYGENMIGGAILVNKEKYALSGYENERFYGWGPEDGERFFRWKALGFRIYRSKGELFHLSHSRDINGTNRSNIQRRIMQRELQENKVSNKNEILIKIANFYYES